VCMFSSLRVSLTHSVRALDELEELVQPLLNGFEACTGLRFVLIGGRAPQQEGSKYKLEV
jgi:hypothetical protein